MMRMNMNRDKRLTPQMLFYFAIVIFMITAYIYLKVQSWPATSLAGELNEYIAERRPLDEFGMTAEASNCQDDLMIDIIPQEKDGLISDDIGHKSSSKMAVCGSWSSQRKLGESGAIYVIITVR